MRTRQRVPYTRAGEVTIRRLDGSVETQPAYRPAENRAVVLTKRVRGYESITTKHPDHCLICKVRIPRGSVVVWWKNLGVSCTRHEPPKKEEIDRLADEQRTHGYL